MWDTMPRWVWLDETEGEVDFGSKKEAEEQCGPWGSKKEEKGDEGEAKESCSRPSQALLEGVRRESPKGQWSRARDRCLYTALQITAEEMGDWYPSWLFDYRLLKNDVWQTRIMKQEGESFPGHKDRRNKYGTLHSHSWQEPQCPLRKMPHFPSPDTAWSETCTCSAEGTSIPASPSDERSLLVAKGRHLSSMADYPTASGLPGKKKNLGPSFLTVEDICSASFLFSFHRELPQYLKSWDGSCTLGMADGRGWCWHRPQKKLCNLGKM